MALLPGVSAEYTQQEGEIIAYTLDFAEGCKDVNGLLIDSIASAVVTATTGIAVGTATVNTTTVQVPVDCTGMTAGSTVYTILCVATLTSGGKRNLAIQITVVAKAAV